MQRFFFFSFLIAAMDNVIQAYSVLRGKMILKLRKYKRHEPSVHACFPSREVFVKDSAEEDYAVV